MSGLRPLPLPRRWTGTILLLIVSYLLLELFSAALYYVLNGQPFSFSTLDEKRSETLQQTDEMLPRGNISFVIHPFKGAVRNYDQDRGRPDGIDTLKPYGHYAEEDPFEASRDPKKAIVALAGGSVSEELFLSLPGRAVLHSYLDHLPMLKGKKVVLITLGAHAYQQPQQLFSTHLYLLQGGKIDLLINLDGRNEALQGYVLQGNGIYPGFFTPWPNVIRQISFTHPSAIADIVIWRKLRRLAAELSHYTRYSVTLSTFWSLADAYCKKNRIEAEREAQNTGRIENKPYFLTGPDTMQDASKEEIAMFMLMVWKNASEQMQLLANSYAFPYFHFLQPHQYIEGAKPLSPEEKRQYYLPREFRNDLLTYAYPFWQRAMVELRAQGINAYDLSYIFQNTIQTTYRDSCCHLNDLGNSILAHAIGKQITSTLQAKKQNTNKAASP